MENNNGKGIFYGVIGVATLVVAIIGATFAYFSATVTPGEGSQDITGTTNSNIAGDLTLTVKKLTFSGTTAATNNLVPADFGTGVTPSTLTETEIGRALSNKCENAGYTGCHVWKIEATTNQTVANANILLDLSMTSGSNKDFSQWSYAIYTGTDTTGTESPTPLTSAATATGLAAVPTGSSAVGTFGTTALSGLDINNNQNLTSEDGRTYYLMVYLNNENKTQNKYVEGDNTTNDATGTYTGSVTMKAAGGQVKASFASNG